LNEDRPRREEKNAQARKEIREEPIEKIDIPCAWGYHKDRGGRDIELYFLFIA
jgi:hypothetical protein